MEIVLGILIGAVLVGGIALVVLRAVEARRPAPAAPEEIARQVAAEQWRHAAAERDDAIRTAVEMLQAQNQGTLASERVLHGQELDAKKSLIDQQLGVMTGELAKIGELVRSFETDRSKKFGELSGALELQRTHIAELAETTQGLREALSSTKVRGQWGERMAEDVLRLAGFVEGVNYLKQRAIATGVPDFTFLLPDDLSLFMDVKFPLDNYLRYLEAEGELEERRTRDDFLRDVRQHVKTLAARDYLDGGRASVDCVLLFIPNEAVYAFIQEQDSSILDDALRRKLVFCSPLTLFAVLAVVRQAVDNFRVERTSGEILTRLLAFEKQWGMFTEKMDKLGRSLETARKDYDELTGTRRRQLERELDKIDDLRRRSELDGTDGEPRLALEA
jgi:DNA recombination protein RmuC